MNVRVIGLAVLLCAPTPARCEGFRVLAWNVESNRPGGQPVSDANVIGRQLTELLAAPETRAGIVALSEVDPQSFQTYKDSTAKGLNAEVDFVTSASGGFRDSDSLMLIVDKSRFGIEAAVELHRFAGIAANFNVADPDSAEFGALRARSPLAVKLSDLSTGKTFWVIVNHLARGEADLRTDQARMLVKWASAFPEPMISAGDHNFDFDFNSGRGNAGFEAMLEGGVWHWLKPDPLIDSNWSDDRRVTDRRVDRYPDSILDFIFVANRAKQWGGKSNVIVRDGDFPDDDKTSDHRPIIADFDPR
jgi:endonuclease/exonuclease/phosphatase family metal-dependent hydrolase